MEQTGTKLKQLFYDPSRPFVCAHGRLPGVTVIVQNSAAMVSFHRPDLKACWHLKNAVNTIYPKIYNLFNIFIN